MGCVFQKKKKLWLFYLTHDPAAIIFPRLLLLNWVIEGIIYPYQYHQSHVSHMRIDHIHHLVHERLFTIFVMPSSGDTISMCKCSTIWFLCCWSVRSGLWLYSHQWYWTQVGMAQLLPINQPRLILHLNDRLSLLSHCTLGHHEGPSRWAPQSFPDSL